MPTNYRAPAIGRAARILEHLAAAGEPPTLSQLARDLGYGKSSTHGLLQGLESLGWVARSREGYRLGPGFLDLARRVAEAGDLAARARPHMERLAEELGEAVFVGAPRGDVVVVLDAAEGRGELRLSSRPGMEIPRFAAAPGKVFLASLPPDQARAALGDGPLPRFTERSITDPAQFMREVDLAWARGYALDDEEYLKGVRAVAAPVRCGAETVAALWVAGFASRLTDGRLRHAADLTVRAAEAISRALSPPAAHREAPSRPVRARPR